jgi:hypothetical protein
MLFNPRSRHPPQSWIEVLNALGVCGAVFDGVWWLNWRAARQLRRAIERLDALARE